MIADAPLSLNFLVFVLAAMVLVPPVMEESAFRGYVRGRLQLAFGPVGAALITALIFVLAHGHFYGLDSVLIGTQISFVYASFVLAYDTYRSGSIVPAVVAHGVMNLPLNRGAGSMLSALALAAALILVARTQIAAGARQLARDWAATPNRSGVVLYALLAAGLMIATMLFLPAAGVLALVAIAGTVRSFQLRTRPRGS